MTSWLPDVNVWVAMHYQAHAQHPAAQAWFDKLNEQEMLVFCRQTQLGFFRLLTTPAVMGDKVLTQRQCWAIYEDWLGGGRAMLRSEPQGIDAAFHARTSGNEAATKIWADAYLAAFAEVAGLRLVTFDKVLAAKVKGAVLLA